MVTAMACLGVFVPLLQGQSTPQQPSTQEDNPFPGDPSKAAAPQKPTTAGQGKDSNQRPDQKPDSTSKPGSQSDNPFPGEDSNAPIIPVDPGPNARPSASGNSPSETAPGHDADADLDRDPVRSPDGPGNAGDDGFSSSRSGLKQMPVEDDNDGRPGKSAKNKTREQVIKEDLDVGRFYADKKNWKAAQLRYGAAFALDPENADAVWGLAEAERRLQLYKEATEHYKLFLSYDPDGPHGREARKALEEVETAKPSVTVAPKPTGFDSVSPN